MDTSPFFYKIGMKTRLLLWIVCGVLPLRASAQEHLSHFFKLEREITLAELPSLSARQVGCVVGNELYFGANQVSRDKRDGYRMPLTLVNLETGGVQSISLQLPEKKHAAPWEQKYWICDLFVDSVRLLVTTQRALLEYAREKEGGFVYRRSLEIEDGDFSFFADGRVVCVSQKNDVGFIVRSCKEREHAWSTTDTLHLPAPFLLQFAPNGYLKQARGKLYFLPTPTPVLQTLDLRGHLLSEMEFSSAVWNSMPEAYVREVSQLPYGPERAMRVLNTSGHYSFPMELFPLSDNSALLFTHQYVLDRKSAGIEASILSLSSIAEKPNRKIVQTRFAQDSVIRLDEFPIYYADRSLCLTLCDSGRLIQIVREADVPYKGVTGRHYYAEVERFFANHDPIVRVRVMRVKDEKTEKR